jgi:peptidyl-dipeptidase Dcp
MDFTLDYPSYVPLLPMLTTVNSGTNGYRFGAKGFQNNEFDNQENVLKIAKLRFDRAQVLGYATHAHFVLEERMAENPEK